MGAPLRTGESSPLALQNRLFLGEGAAGCRRSRSSARADALETTLADALAHYPPAARRSSCRGELALAAVDSRRGPATLRRRPGSSRSSTIAAQDRRRRPALPSRRRWSRSARNRSLGRRRGRRRCRAVCGEAVQLRAVGLEQPQTGWELAVARERPSPKRWPRAALSAPRARPLLVEARGGAAQRSSTPATPRSPARPSRARAACRRLVDREPLSASPARARPRSRRRSPRVAATRRRSIRPRRPESRRRARDRARRAPSASRAAPSAARRRARPPSLPRRSRRRSGIRRRRPGAA